MAIRYAVDLTDTERTELREIISKKKAKRSTLMNASILRKADRTCGWTNADMALAYDVSTKNVEQRKNRFVDEGCAAALYRTPVTHAHRRKITGDAAAHLIALSCRQAPEGHERWTFRRLAEKMVEWDMVDAVSHATMRRTVTKMHVNLGKSKHGVCRRSKMPLVSARWRTSEISRNNRMIPRVHK